MKKIAGGIGMAFFVLHASASATSKINLDIDMDGVPDTVEFSPAASQDGQSTEFLVKITYSRSGASVAAVLTSDLGDIDIYPAGQSRAIIVDYSNRTSRSPAELNYHVYEWSDERQSLCLRVAVSGESRDQLRKELLPRISSVDEYEDCIPLENASPIQHSPITHPWDAPPTWLHAYMGEQLPEWAALRIAARLGSKTKAYGEMIADAQAKLGNDEGAAILYRSLLKLDPHNHSMTMTLAMLFHANGDDTNACQVYAPIKGHQNSEEGKALSAVCSAIEDQD